MNRLAPHNAAPRTEPYSRARECSVPDCGKKHHGNGFCRNHHASYRRNGDPVAHRQRFETPEEAIKARSRREGECVVWTGPLNKKGYGIAWDGQRGTLAHRIAYRISFGNPPAGTVIDHACWNRACINPEHLRAIPQRNNSSSRSGAPDSSTTGHRNVTIRPNGRYQVSVNANGKRTYGGLFDDLEEAANAAAAIRERVFGEFAGRG